MVRKSSGGIKIDFTDVEGGGGLVSEGMHVVAVHSVEQKEGKAADYLNWRFTVVAGSDKGRTLYHITSLSKQSLWALRGLLEALGEEVPSGLMLVSFSELVGLQCRAEVHHEVYEDKPQAKVVGFWPYSPNDLRSTGNRGTSSDPDDDFPSNLKKQMPVFTEEDIADMSEDQLQRLIDQHSLGLDLSQMKTLRRKANAVIDALQATGRLDLQ